MLEELEDIKEKTLSQQLESARDSSKFNLIVRHYSYGDRMSYVAADEVLFEDLQNSRGISVFPESTVESIVETAILDMELSGLDKSRISEIELMQLQHKEYIDIGFRIPRLLKHYGSKGMNTLGLDISHLNVAVAKKLGYSAMCVNISLHDVEMPKIENPCLITCYHILEHTHEPLVALDNIKRMMTYGSVLHIEVPIEPGVPRLRYGHMSEFHQGDLEKMLVQVGFKTVIMTESNSTIDRCVAVLIL